MTATILVVDDLEQNVKLLEAKLLKEYYIVHTASSGHDAIDVLAKEKIDVVLLDVMMPGMDGFETCRKIKQSPQTAHIPVVMVTALSDVEDKVKGLESGADEFLTKPVDDVALFARVRSLSRMKIVLDELRLRNQTNREFNERIIPIEADYVKARICVIDTDVIQSKNITKTLSKITTNIKMIHDLEEVNSALEFKPDVVIVSCQLEEVDPLRIVVNLRSKEQMSNTSFVLMTEEEMQLVIRGLELGVNDYFFYPVDDSELMARIKTQLRRKFYQDNIKNHLEQSVNMSVKDGLTGLFNRRYFDSHITNSLANAADGELALLMLDIDFFKKVNDTYGHQIGDQVIKVFADIASKNVQPTDLLARYGGEEFVVIIHNAIDRNVMEIAQNIRSSIQAYNFADIHAGLSCTTSIGLALCKKGEYSPLLRSPSPVVHGIDQSK